jgi:ankyrin repeat protein
MGLNFSSEENNTMINDISGTELFSMVKKNGFRFTYKFIGEINIFPEKYLLDKIYDELGSVKAIELIELGCSFEYDDPLIIRAFDKNDYDFVKYLIEKGANFHVKNEYLLINSMLRKNISFARFLIEKGSNINVKNGIIMKIAIDDNNRELVKELYEKGGYIFGNEDEYLKKLNDMINN